LLGQIWGYIVNRIEAKAKIRNHLKTNGQNYCFITESMVLMWWRVLNDAIFGGKLKQPKRFELRNFHKETLGWCKSHGRKSTGNVVIGLRREYDDRNTFLTVLAHEMVHQSQWEEDSRMTHGGTFHVWERRVNQATGLPLGEYVEV